MIGTPVKLAVPNFLCIDKPRPNGYYDSMNDTLTEIETLLSNVPKGHKYRDIGYEYTMDSYEFEQLLELVAQLRKQMEKQ